jgi:hypothetical protein
MACRYVEQGGGLHGDADAATNNHFDQDGLAGLLFLVDPDGALAHRELLLDLARAGDFATYTDRRAARASMALSAMVNAAEPAPYPELCARLYQQALPLAFELLDHPDRFADLWRGEDAELTAAEEAVAAGRVHIDEVPDIDLAVVRPDPSLHPTGGHRFGGEHFAGVHPMALHAATSCVRLLVRAGDRWTYTDRYETWVQYRSRELPRRVDLAPLAAELGWVSTPPSRLTPTMAGEGGDDAVDRIVAYLRTARPAWQPYEPAA